MSSSIAEYIRREVPDWDDEVVARARFKAFSGQRYDWEPRYLFWKDLILRVARHLGVFIIQASEVKNTWFNRGGLTPLCIDRVLEKAPEVVKVLSENHWTSFCIITMGKFQSICNGSNEADVILSYLSGIGKARLLSVSKRDIIEGVKVSLVPTGVPAISSIDYDVLHLTWTMEKLQQQLDVIDHRYQMSKKAALASIKSGNKQIALRHARKLKLTSESREKCTSMLNRVEEVLNVITTAESTKKVSEAIKIGARAIKENGISIEEVQVCLEELDENIALQKEVEEILVSTPLQSANIEDEDLEEEFRNLELELGDEIRHAQPSKITADGSDRVQESQESTSDELPVQTKPSLAVVHDPARAVEIGESIESLSNNLSSLRLEAA